MKTIPVIDLHGNYDPAAPAARAAVADLHHALTTYGFAYIAGHNVSDASRTAAFEASREFHASPLEKKNSLAINEFHRGYMALASDTIKTSSVAQVTRPNMSESLMLMHEVAGDDPDYGRPMNGPNQWPDWIPEFRPRVERYIGEVDTLGRYVIRLMAMSLDLDPYALDAPFAKPTTFLRMLHYPPQAPDDADNFGSAPHTDYGFVTLLAQDDSGGLQVRPRGTDHWIDAPPIPGTYVLNVADMLARWTNNRFVSTPHRVVNRSGKDRYSLPYFLDTHIDAVIDCLPTCVSEANPAKFPPLRYGDRLEQHMSTNYSNDHRSERPRASKSPLQTA
ncbi:MAG: isopenicillin N synthase family oxygenase [Burkholderiales bacterium]|nr:isopenicillin N synthase family oxygenase [Burkholderiales bacterium]